MYGGCALFFEVVFARVPPMAAPFAFATSMRLGLLVIRFDHTTRAATVRTRTAASFACHRAPTHR
jgi:hypothetical protein